MSQCNFLELDKMLAKMTVKFIVIYQSNISPATCNLNFLKIRVQIPPSLGPNSVTVEMPHHKSMSGHYENFFNCQDCRQV